MFTFLSWCILGYVIIGLIFLYFNRAEVEEFMHHLEKNEKNLLLQIEGVFSVKPIINLCIILSWPWTVWLLIKD